MAEKQTIEEFHFKPGEIMRALRDKGYELPPGNPRMSVGNEEDHNYLVLRFGVKAYDHIPSSHPFTVEQEGDDRCTVCGEREHYRLHGG